MENRELPFLSNFGFMLTYKCTIACPHCIVKAGPHRTEEMKVEDAINWINQIKFFTDQRKIVAGISLTGGEPFYNQELLKIVADYAASMGFIVSVVSNGFWATTKEKAIEVITSLSSISFFSISTDIYHNEFIPFANIKNAVFACKKLNKEYNIAIATISEEDLSYMELLDNLLEITERDKIETALLVSVGRAETEVTMNNLDFSVDPSKAACSMASFPVIFPNGKVIACIGPPIVIPNFNPLYLGNLNAKSLNEILDQAEKNTILHAIRIFGPSILVEQLRLKDLSDLIPSSFQVDSICDVCNKLFSNLKICQALDEIGKDELFSKKVAYGRYYFLNETEMIEKLNLDQEK
jgi:MoaA/NifB/PqqE/SkfB family radical SAM enzyme